MRQLNVKQLNIKYRAKRSTTCCAGTKATESGREHYQIDQSPWAKLPARDAGSLHSDFHLLGYKPWQSQTPQL